MAEKGRVMTGARARILVNGKKVGYARNVSYRAETIYEDIDVLDNVEVEEMVVTKYRVSGNVGVYRIVGESLKAVGLVPKTGTTPQQHLTNILTMGTLTMAIEDSKTGKIIALLTDVKFGSINMSIDAVGVSQKDADFKAIREMDESEI